MQLLNHSKAYSLLCYLPIANALTPLRIDKRLVHLTNNYPKLLKALEGKKRVLLIEKTTRFEVAKRKGNSEKEIKRLFPRAHKTHLRHIESVKWLEHFLEDYYGFSVVKFKTSGCTASRNWDATNLEEFGAIFCAGGDGTYLEGASVIPSIAEDSNVIFPIFGVNTDPYRSEGYLCLGFDSHSIQPIWTSFFKTSAAGGMRATTRPTFDESSANNYVAHILHSLLTEGSCIPFIRQRVRVKLKNLKTGEEHVQPHKAVNDVIVAEQKFSKALYAEVQIDDSPKQRIKCSGLLVSTGSGSSAWAYNACKVSVQAVRSIVECIKEKSAGHDVFLDNLPLEEISSCHNNRQLFHPSSTMLRFVIREPIENRVFSKLQGSGEAKRISVTPLADEAYVHLDGIESIYLPPGYTITMEIHPEDGIWTAK